MNALDNKSDKATGSAAEEESGASTDTPKDDESASSNNLVGTLTSIGIFGFWAAFSVYGFLLSPNQTPYRDAYFLEKLLNLRGDDGVTMNAVLVSLWNIMGVWPAVYASILIPASRTKSTPVPAWPFCVGSVAFGAFALLPYFALWTPGPPALPSDEERSGWASKVIESKVTAGLLLLAAVSLIVGAVTAPAADWTEFTRYFKESRLIHVTSLDFLLLTSFAPFWLYNDMSYRNWEPRDSWGLALLSIPVLGPCLYLLLRPSLPENKSE